jgi:Carboxypeptidase regulatory-like domain/TonB-dependent Receptor Plug Domain/TonB dependent receptor-like, beta-barrel
LIVGRSRTIAAAMLIVVASAVPNSAAQITAATVSGVVNDEAGGVLPRVEVTLKNVETGFTRSVVTSADGAYSIPGLPPGTYDASASLPGFTPALRSGIRLAIGQQEGLNLTLRVGASEVVMVAGTAALVDTKSSTLSALVDQKTIEDLPLNGRNFIELALLQPGVVVFNMRSTGSLTSRGQQININGANGRANSYLLDGANMSSYAGVAVSTAADTTLGVDMIREFRVVTNAFSADYGRAMGGVISVATKSGTNQLQGSAFEFFRNSAMDARNYFDVGEQPPFERNQFGATIGGPIRKNKTFLFAGVERLVERLVLTKVTTVPSAAARAGELWPINPLVRPYLDLFPMPNGADQGGGIARLTFPADQSTGETFGQVRIDHSFSGADALFVRYTVDGASRQLPTIYPRFSNDQQSRSQWLTIEERHTLGAALLTTSRFSYSRVKLGQLVLSEGAGPELAFVPGQPTMGEITVPGLDVFGPTRNNPSNNDIEYFTFSNDLSASKGRHFLKAGVLIERVDTHSLTSTGLRGRFMFSSVQNFLAGNPTRFTGVLPGAQVERSRRSTLFGFYAQDDLTVHARLTLNLGLRYEFTTVPNDVHDRDSSLRNLSSDGDFTVGPIFVNPSLRNLGPRVGFAWDVAGDGTLSFRGGAGVYYDTDGTFNTALLAATFSPPFTYPVNVRTPSFPRPSLEVDPTDRAARAVDYHVQQPRMLTGHVDVERQVLTNLVVRAGYAGSRGYNLVQAIEGNPAVPQILPDGTKFFPPDAVRQNPNWGSVDLRTTGGRSWYNALQLGATKRFSQGSQWQVSYTFGKVTDETQGQVVVDATNSSVFPQDPIDPRNDRGPADFDVRHVLAMNVTYDLPFGEQLTGLAGAIGRGWQVNGLAMLRSGVPFSPAIQSGVNWSRSGNIANGAENRPNLRPGVNVDDIVLGGPDRYFDTQAFVLQPQGFLGNAGRNMLRGPGFVNVDVSAVKQHTWHQSGTAIEFRFEAFNVFNRANFAIPNRVVFAGDHEGEAPLPTAGQITSTVNDARQMQLGVKLRF